MNLFIITTLFLGSLSIVLSIYMFYKFEQVISFESEKMNNP